MAIMLTETQDTVVVRVEGDLDLASVATYHSMVAKAMESRGERRLVIDLRGTDYIDSAGLEQLLIANRKLMAGGERLQVLVTTGSQPQTVLTITGFSAVMDILPDADE